MEQEAGRHCTQNAHENQSGGDLFDGIQAYVRRHQPTRSKGQMRRTVSQVVKKTNNVQSFRSTLSKTIQLSGWMVEQISFMTGTWSLNEEELKKILEYFKVPNTSMETIRSKLTMKIFDEYANLNGLP